MKILLTTISLLLSCCLQAFAATPAKPAQNINGLVEVNDRKIYVDYTKPQDNKPTIVVVNGLTYSTYNWARMTRYLKEKGYGVVLFDMYGMGTTLLSNPLPSSAILFSQQVADLKVLLQTLKIKAPYNLVGLSYGGGIIHSFATHFPKDINNLILIAPYTEFLETQKNWLLQQIKYTRAMFPQNPASDDELTDFFIRQLVYTTYPSAEISSVENPYKLEGITRLVQGIRTYQPIDEVKLLPANKLHLVIPENDQYIPQSIYAKYWDLVPQRARASRTFVQYSEHKLPEAFPRFTAQFIQGVLDGQPILFEGSTLFANPLTMDLKRTK